MTLLRLRTCRVATGLAFGLALLTINSPSAGSEPTGIVWRDDLPRALESAASQDRLVWLQFTGPWCHNCRRMEREVFNTTPVVRLANDRFVPVQLRSDLHEELALGYGLSSLPATVILRPNGEVIAGSQGYKDSRSFAAFLSNALASEGRLKNAAPIRTELARSTEGPAPALGGHCPVGLVDEHRLVAGDSSLAVVHDGRLYRLSSEASRRRFRNNPDLYAPVNGGRCPVSQVDRGEDRPGSPKWGVLYGGHLYLCGDGSARQRFLRHPERYTHVHNAERGFCAHCWALDGLPPRDRADLPLVRADRHRTYQAPAYLQASRTANDRPRR
jgi:YHS domain-containing protein/thiol-disulfide isomerase/thioredoxin